MKAINKYTSAVFGLSFTMLIISLTACNQGADPDIKTTNTEASTGYNAGYEFGFKLALLRQKQPDIKLDEAFKGMLDALAETSTQIDSTKMCATLQVGENLQADKNITTNSNQPEIPARSRGYKDDFAALNARRDGVVLLPSGVQYEVLKASNGKQPDEGDAVLINYEASLTNGSVFDTTYEDGEPLHMPLDEVAVPGLKQALLLMNEGAQWRVVIPPSMGFGRSGNNQLRRRDLIYEIELVSIEKPKTSEL